ncbi:hypothetical protein Tco_0029073 [Tanacetum coccineum]
MSSLYTNVSVFNCMSIGNEARRRKMAAWSKSVVCTRVIVLDKLIQRAASQLSDELPESREAARALLLELQNANEKSPILAP